MNKHITSLAAALSIGLIAAPSYAENLITAADPEAIMAIAKGYGSAELSTDDDGDPKITGRMRGTRYTVFFYGCSNGKKCEDIQFATAWSGHKISLDDINSWNKTMRYGKAYLDDDQDPALEMSANLNYGVTTKNLDDTFDWWKVAVEGFEKDVLKN